MNRANRNAAGSTQISKSTRLHTEMTSELTNACTRLVLSTIDSKFPKLSCSGISEKREKIWVFVRNELDSVHRIGIRQPALLMISTRYPTRISGLCRIFVIVVVRRPRVTARGRRSA